jgi:DNA-binding transcriptional LysR family regulator
MQRAALDGVGVAMLAEDDVCDDLAADRLVRVLDDPGRSGVMPSTAGSFAKSKMLAVF